MVAPDTGHATELDVGLQDRFARRYLERRPQALLSLQQVDPLDRSLPNPSAIDLLSCRVSNKLARRCERLLERRTKQPPFRVSHILTHPTTITDNRPTRRCTNTPLGTKDRSSHRLTQL
jgi:hypothetical protein